MVRSKFWRARNNDFHLLLPPYPPTGVPLVTPEYDRIEDIIIELWDYCMELEDEYHRTADPSVLIKFAIGIMTVQYWEDVLLNLEGFDVYQFYF